jgi:hypothetical protein
MCNIHIFLLKIVCQKDKSFPIEEIVYRTSTIILNSLFLSHTWFFKQNYLSRQGQYICRRHASNPNEKSRRDDICKYFTDTTK